MVCAGGRLENGPMTQDSAEHARAPDIRKGRGHPFSFLYSELPYMGLWLIISTVLASVFRVLILEERLYLLQEAACGFQDTPFICTCPTSTQGLSARFLFISSHHFSFQFLSWPSGTSKGSKVSRNFPPCSSYFGLFLRNQEPPWGREWPAGLLQWASWEPYGPDWASLPVSARAHSPTGAQKLGLFSSQNVIVEGTDRRFPARGNCLLGASDQRR